MDFSLGGVEIGDWRWPHLEGVTDARFLDYIFCFCLKKKRNKCLEMDFKSNLDTML